MILTVGGQETVKVTGTVKSVESYAVTVKVTVQVFTVEVSTNTYLQANETAAVIHPGQVTPLGKVVAQYVLTGQAES